MVSQLMFMRVQFRKGEQRKFLKEVIARANLPSVRELVNRLADVKYSSSKNYYTERRTLSKELFDSLCQISDFNNNFKITFLEDNWGKVKGGKNKKK